MRRLIMFEVIGVIAVVVLGNFILATLPLELRPLQAIVLGAVFGITGAAVGALAHVLTRQTPPINNLLGFDPESLFDPTVPAGTEYRFDSTDETQAQFKPKLQIDYEENRENHQD